MKKRIKYKLEKKKYEPKDKLHDYLCQRGKKRHYKKGYWQKELNRVYFKAYGFDCMITRNPSTGFLCGYVGVTEKHPYYSKDYSDNELNDIDVHGGLTYSEECDGFICHPGENHVKWFGFDCGHSQDHFPTHGKEIAELYNKSGLSTPTYKKIGFLKNECLLLAKQFREVEKGE